MGKFLIFTLIIECLLVSSLMAQHSSFKAGSLYGFSVDVLLALPVEQGIDVEIVLASKKAEKLSDSPVSASMITREDILKAVCTSIMEVMRLVPGVIVREQTNGNYDMHLRGLDNVPPYPLTATPVNSTILVMIDNRPVYNSFSGGSLWETLLMDINDIDRVEVVRGPSSVMFGGLFASFKPFSKWDISFSTYYLGAQKHYYLLQISGFDIRSKTLVNTKISYKPVKNVGFYINGRNLLNDHSVEYPGADRAGASIFGGVNFEI